MRTLDEYQQAACKTAIYPGQRTFIGKTYCALKLNGEAGEVAEKIGKAWRDDSGIIGESKRHELGLELGDVLWYVSVLADELGFSLSRIAELNLEKLSSRKARGTLSGSGDNR